MKRLVFSILLSTFAAAGMAQVFQYNTVPFKFRGLKGDSLVVIPSGVDTPFMSNPKWGENINGALFLRTGDSSLWGKIGNRYSRITGAGGGGSGWALTGNSGTTSSNFIGTTDSRSLRFRTNNIERVILDSLGRTIYYPNGRQALAPLHLADSSKGIFATTNYNGNISSGYGSLRIGNYTSVTNTWDISTGYVGGGNQVTSGLRLTGTDDAGGQHAITIGQSSDLGTNRSITFNGNNTNSGNTQTEFRFIGSIN